MQIQLANTLVTAVFGFGPLSEAIVTGDKGHVLNLLARNDYDLNEKNVFNQTIFHLAVSSQQPNLLRIILKTALHRGGSQQFDTLDVHGNTALDFAALCSGQACRNKNLPKACTDCSCWLPFNILQSHGWQLSVASFWRPRDLLKRSSYSCALKLIEMIKSSRRKLQAEGQRSLSKAESRDFRLDRDYTLDGYARNVVQSLVQHGVSIPQIPTNPRLLDGGSIYHHFARDINRGTGHWLWLADLLFENGFKDVDHKDSLGATPLMIANGLRGIRQSAFTLWLLNHGANPSLKWPAHVFGGAANPSLRAAHTLLHLNWNDLCKSPNIKYFREITLRIAPLELFDGCQCGCIQAEGCGTTQILFRELWSYSRSGHYPGLKYKPRQSQPDSKVVHSARLPKYKIQYRKGSNEMEMVTPKSTPIIVRRLSKFLRYLAIDFSQWAHVSTSALRLFTFEALGMRHTCCKMPRPPEFSPDEIVEIQEEDHIMLTLLDQLVEEFTIELRISGDSLDKFLGRYWVGRIEEVLDELNAARMTEEEIKAAEELGIKWETSSKVPRKMRRPRLSFAKEIEVLERRMDRILLESVRARPG